jgi:hypothetical protein
MALNTLLGTEQITGFKVNHMEDFVDKETWKKIKTYININHADNTISFKIQDGAIAVYGENGCQVDALIVAAHAIIDGLNKLFPCNENEIAMLGLEIAEMALMSRKQDRERRGVEGTPQV